jgi:hypothetical protein
MPTVDPAAQVAWYLAHGYRIVTWPGVGDAKGPTTKGWPSHPFTQADYHRGDRVGLLLGTEISPGKFLHDVDIDWAPGALIAQNLLPPSGFVFGHGAKRISHYFYTLPEALPSCRYEALDGTCLLELRGTKREGDVGYQTMVPPSVWSKNGVSEPLAWVHEGAPAHLDTAVLRARLTYGALGMLLAHTFGQNGFGHAVRLAWAGFLLRAGIPPEVLISLGEGISAICNNTELTDVRRVVESTVARLATEKKRVSGGPALAAVVGAQGKALVTRINEWLGRDSDFVRRSVGGAVIKDHLENIARAVEKLGHELSHDQFSGRLLLDRVQALEDQQVLDLWFRIDREFHFRPTKDFFITALQHLAWSHSVHPVRDYLQSLTWDGVPRVEQWLVSSAGAVPSAYLYAVSRIVLVAAVRRIRDPGVKYDEMLVLEGQQGLNKSSALRALCPKGEWFSDDLPLNLTSQRMIESTQGKWIIEASDLAGKRKTDIEQLKSMLSRQVDGPARMAYARLPVERPRQFIIVGTTNSAAYLTDPTGARRFWPVQIKAFDVAWIHEHRDQLWAEASVRELQGESIRLPEELWPEAAEEQEKRREVDTWEGVLRRVLLGTPPGHDGRRQIATSALWDALGIPVERRDRGGSIRITEIMQRLGFKRTKVRPAGEEQQVGFITDRSELLELGESVEDLADVVTF